MSNCLVCARHNLESTVVGVCLGCGALLCAEHRIEATRQQPAGMDFGCPHVGAAVEQLAGARRT